jgi:hypothetical protein
VETKDFAPEDFAALSSLVLDAWGSAVEQDWSVPAGTLTWSCLETADHTIDCVFSYALFLASGKQDAYPNFGELHALPDAGPADMLDGLRAVTTMLSATIAAAAPDAEAIIWQRPQPTTAAPRDFAARGGLELILHAHDVCSGLGVPFAPPQDLCRRLWQHTQDWPGNVEDVEATDDAWADLLRRSGR